MKRSVNCTCQLHRLNRRPASRSMHSVGSNQEYQSLTGSAITLRLLALITRSPISDQSETREDSSTMALTWCY